MLLVLNLFDGTAYPPGALPRTAGLSAARLKAPVPQLALTPSEIIFRYLSMRSTLPFAKPDRDRLCSRCAALQHGRRSRGRLRRVTTVPSAGADADGEWDQGDRAGEPIAPSRRPGAPGRLPAIVSTILRAYSGPPDTPGPHGLDAPDHKLVQKKPRFCGPS